MKTFTIIMVDKACTECEVLARNVLEDDLRSVVDELFTMANRIDVLADAGYADMEGADEIEFRISSELWSLADLTNHLRNSAYEIKSLIPRLS
jgi:hypothetical protein